MSDFEKEYQIDTLNEITDNLNRLSEIIIELEKETSIDPFIDEVFRLSHNIKGNSKSAGFDKFAEAAHELESLLMLVKEKDLKYSSKIFDVLCLSQGEFSDTAEKILKDLDHKYEFDSLIVQIKDALKPEESGTDSQSYDFSILLVDDEKEILDLLEDQISLNYSANIVTASNAVEATEFLKSQVFNVILTDYDMPSMTGLEFIRNTRNGHTENKDTPMIMLTAYKPDFQESQDVFEKVFFLEKPFSNKTLDFMIKCSIKGK